MTDKPTPGSAACGYCVGATGSPACSCLTDCGHEPCGWRGNDYVEREDCR